MFIPYFLNKLYIKREDNVKLEYKELLINLFYFIQILKNDKIKEVSYMEEKEEIKNTKQKRSIKKIIIDLIPYVIILLVVVLVRTFIVTPIIVSGPSMQPTLDGGELMILNKMSDLERFDIVVVDAGNEEIIKRIIAMPGETISCEDGIIYVNGRRQDEEYSQGITFDFDKVVLEDDEYFVMGDNRENSADSRHMGAFKKEQIKGTAKIILFPFNEFGTVQ